jgi:hypothetical protein
LKAYFASAHFVSLALFICDVELSKGIHATRDALSPRALMHPLELLTQGVITRLEFRHYAHQPIACDLLDHTHNVIAYRDPQA